MLDIKFIKENPDLIRESIRKKHVNLNIDDLLLVDKVRLEYLSLVESLRAEQNKISDKIASESDPQTRQRLIEDMRIFKEDLKNREEKLKETMKEWHTLMLQVPNVPDMSVPDGVDDADNKEIKNWGNIPDFGFEPKDHVELMTKLGMADFERGAKAHGFRGYFLTGDGASLCFAIWNLAFEFFTKKGFVPVIPPTIVRKQNLYGTAHLPGDVEDYYMTQDGDTLIGTAEVSLMAMHSEEMLDKKSFPVKYLGFSPCYRREAGSHGKDVRGLIRVHEFFKLEQVVLCEASHETSVRLHEQLNRNTEEFIELLGIPYRTVINCGGDLGLGQVKKFDIELWVPKEGKYREISSASYFHDFQCRRFNIRYKDEDGQIRYAHSLNATAIPTPRILVSIIENFQQADGSIKVPEALIKYLGKDFIKGVETEG